MVLCCFLFSAVLLQAQTSPKNKTLSAEDEQPIMFQFEPNYASAQLKKREALVEKIKAIDTLQISEKKRLRLIKALYKDSNSLKFQKTILVDTH